MTTQEPNGECDTCGKNCKFPPTAQEAQALASLSRQIKSGEIELGGPINKTPSEPGVDAYYAWLESSKEPMHPWGLLKQEEKDSWAGVLVPACGADGMRCPIAEACPAADNCVLVSAMQFARYEGQQEEAAICQRRAVALPAMEVPWPANAKEIVVRYPLDFCSVEESKKPLETLRQIQASDARLAADKTMQPAIDKIRKTYTPTAAPQLPPAQHIDTQLWGPQAKDQWPSPEFKERLKTEGPVRPDMVYCLAMEKWFDKAIIGCCCAPCHAFRNRYQKQDEEGRWLRGYVVEPQPPKPLLIPVPVVPVATSCQGAFCGYCSDCKRSMADAAERRDWEKYGRASCEHDKLALTTQATICMPRPQYGTPLWDETIDFLYRYRQGWDGAPLPPTSILDDALRLVTLQTKWPGGTVYTNLNTTDIGKPVRVWDAEGNEHDRCVECVVEVGYILRYSLDDKGQRCVYAGKPVLEAIHAPAPLRVEYQEAT